MVGLQSNRCRRKTQKSLTTAKLYSSCQGLSRHRGYIKPPASSGSAPRISYHCLPGGLLIRYLNHLSRLSVQRSSGLSLFSNNGTGLVFVWRQTKIQECVLGDEEHWTLAGRCAFLLPLVYVSSGEQTTRIMQKNLWWVSETMSLGQHAPTKLERQTFLYLDQEVSYDKFMLTSKRTWGNVGAQWILWEDIGKISF